MLTFTLTLGFILGIGSSLLALKLLPVKLTFSWNDSKVVSGVKGKVRKLHPNYCGKCDATPCADGWQHQYDRP